MERETELLVRYRREQDPEAFRALVEGHQDMVFAACRRILGNRADAEDAAQDCFFRLARHAERLRAPIAGWLHTVAVRVSLDALRKRKSLRARHEAARLEARRPPPHDPTWDEVKGAVDTAIAQLPERLRVPLVLYYLEQRTQEEIAEELGVSQPAVSQRLKRAVGALRRKLRREGFTSLDAALAPLLAGQAFDAAPASLTAALGKMAIAGIAPGGTAGAGAGTVAVAGGLSAGKAAALVTGAVVVIAGLALLVHLARMEMRTAQGARAPAPVQPGSGSAQPAVTTNIAAPGPLVLNPDGRGASMFLDLDSGRLRSLPGGMTTPGAMVAWMRQNGADVLYSRQVSGAGLLAVDMLVERLAGEDPDAQAAEFFRQTALAAVPVGIVKLAMQDATPTAYAYRTRDGGVGILEITGLADDAGQGLRLTFRPLGRP